MKKILTVMLVLLLLAGCSPKKKVEEDPVNDVPMSEPVAEVVGGWTVNIDLPEMNDAYFDSARKDVYGAVYSPLFELGTQVVAGINARYLCYGTPIVPDAKTSFKIVTVYRDLDGNAEITNVSDFSIINYIDEFGTTTPTGLAGGWTDHSEFANMLSVEEKAVFEKAFEGYDGMGFTPIAKLASQVVAGTNYAFLATGTTVTAEPVTHLYVVTIYSDLQGGATVNNICGLDLSSFSGE